ncbi:MAG: type II toxin-antitoxin system VapC family toxin [Thermaerobacter sp.]|nr:type II toxin-antitoxin system VapC family toxin [Thermaerobacter sp.]
MNFLLDTNVVSEWTKPRPDPGVVQWLADADEDRIFISVATLAEVRYGVERMQPGSRRDRLERWIADELPNRFEHRIAVADAEVANMWGKVLARGYAIGRPIASMDALIAATAIHYELALVTRNVSDFEALDLPLVDPWASRDS